MGTTTKPSTSFWVIAVLAILWNLMGVMVYLGQAYMTEEMRSLMDKDQLAIIENAPAWAVAAFAIAVWVGLLSSILLIFRRKMAKVGFTISFIGIIIQLIYNFGIADAYSVYGASGLITPILTVAIGLYLISHSNRCIKLGLLT
ncbi:hypothetical protein [Polaribacter porphyrae]|uniref:Sugar transporter n=1 Tax=Polaribacter porphyrae TaxID=1137780 RepID=A0A2S7WL52_9FLAO|nr:hypothetical protein [Polaribacter porphyrae]PQJ78303.1 hypothetical protein BTO18_03450 [Polaribacter porphyrae]